MDLSPLFLPLSSFVDFLHVVGRRTLSDFTALDEHMRPLANLVGLDVASLNILVCMFATFPVSFLFRSLPGPAAKHSFSLIAGLFVVQFCLRQYWIHSLVSSLLSYLCIIILPPRYSPVVISVIAVFWVCLVHVDKLYNTAEDIDYTGVQMVLTIKLTSLAFNIFDGQTLFGQTEPVGISERIIAERKSRAVRHIPSPLEYFSYMYFFGGILTGPAFDFVEYSSSVDMSKYGAKGAFVPSPVIPALKKLLYSLIFMMVHLLMAKDFTVASLTSPEFLSKGFLARLYYTWCMVLVHKSKFYFIWLLTEGGCILCSFGFEGYSEKGEALWEGLNNIDVVAVEMGQSIKDTTTNWNKNTSLWLRRYVYERSSGPYHLFTTYVISAMWHGFQPGYYAFFLSAAIGQETARAMRQKFRYRFMQADGQTPKPAKILYDSACFLITQSVVAYTAVAFFILRLDLTLAFWGSMGYFGHLLILLPWLVLPFLPGGPKRPRVQPGAEKKAE